MEVHCHFIALFFHEEQGWVLSHATQWVPDQTCNMRCNVSVVLHFNMIAQWFFHVSIRPCTSWYVETMTLLGSWSQAPCPCLLTLLLLVQEAFPAPCLWVLIPSHLWVRDVFDLRKNSAISQAHLAPHAWDLTVACKGHGKASVCRPGSVVLSCYVLNAVLSFLFHGGYESRWS